MEIKKRIWRISISENCFEKAIENGEEKFYLVGYQNGLSTARRKESYYNQRTKDKESYDVFFEPCPNFMSYSFFLGFFEQAIDTLIEGLENTNDSNIFYKRQILDLFKKKYVFSFLKDKSLEYKKKVDSYLDAAVEERINKEHGTK